MNWAIRLMNLRLMLACCAALLLGASSTASAAPMAIDFSLIPATTTISATGTAVVDSSLLAPNIFTDDLNDLVSVSITFTGLTASPSSTTFTKDDLAFWVFSTEFSGEIFDMNFFMRGVPSNTDGYAIDGVQVLTLALCNAPADPIQGGCPARTGLDTFTIAITDIRPVDGTVPEPTTLSLLGLGLAGMYARRRHQCKRS